MTGSASGSSAIEVLLEFYRAERIYMAAGGVAAGVSFDDMGAALDPEVVLHQSPDLPWGGDWIGYEGFKGWSTEMSRHWDMVDVQDPAFFENGDQVIVSCRLVTRSRLTGESLDYPMAQLVTVREGRITEFRAFYWNVPHYRRACGLGDPS
ncbi:nuclear transport factor 2 family protein [Mycobacterium sp. 21AC1]|uniref:nuclear transport factor 2 family protein n=1 Tax=[Mycobacterium] appelbergii TaxID=2939269 RepID=UPI002939028E|nr:nuclear transport factor 2 family protein [Mycobacterium sp. 21AC1]MDV3127022.1 nuclear transport factor 2 family protein [Mycobacterium sp. 21AC1]